MQRWVKCAPSCAAVTAEWRCAEHLPNRADRRSERTVVWVLLSTVQIADSSGISWVFIAFASDQPIEWTETQERFQEKKVVARRFIWSITPILRFLSQLICTPLWVREAATGRFRGSFLVHTQRKLNWNASFIFHILKNPAARRQTRRKVDMMAYSY